MAYILVVDDDADVAALTGEVLASDEHEVQIAHSGHEGLARLRASPHTDCVVLDVEMPWLDGPGVARQMVPRDAGDQRIPILLVSGRGDLSAVAARVGTPYFLTKGSADFARALLAMVRRMLDEQCMRITA